MRTPLCYGFCHTIILDKDSKFYSICQEALDLLQINCHVLSGDNHNPMMVERVNRYLTKGLKIMTNEQDSIRVALKATRLLLYAWNSCPIPGTDISWSLVAIGCEFAFPIDDSTNKHWELTSPPSSVESYSQDLAMHLSALREVAQLQVKNSAHTIGNWSTCVDRTRAPNLLAMLFFPGMLSVQMPQRAALISFNTPSLDHGASHQSSTSKALHTKSSIAPCRIQRIKSMPQTYHRTPLSSSLSNQLRALTIDMVNSTNLSKQAHSKRPALTGLNWFHHFKSRRTTSWLTQLLPSTGPASRNWMMTSLSSHGPQRRNAPLPLQWHSHNPPGHV